jgi:RTX calcium-binding nonapeptide repeat (4 copies)
MRHVERLSQREIHRRTGIHRDTIRRALASPKPPSYGPRPRRAWNRLLLLLLYSETAVTVNLAAGTLTGADPATDSDTLVNIEDVGGSFFGDTIIGDAGPNALRGDVGADTIAGGGGDDLLIGGCSAAPAPHFFFEDVFDCSKTSKPDTLDGGPGTDRCKDGKTVTACEAVPKRARPAG